MKFKTLTSPLGPHVSLLSVVKIFCALNFSLGARKISASALLLFLPSCSQLLIFHYVIISYLFKELVFATPILLLFIDTIKDSKIVLMILLTVLFV